MIENTIFDADIENQNIFGIVHSESSSYGTKIEQEEPWSDKIEFMLEKWKNQLDKNSELQEISGYLAKKKYQYLTVPTIIIPFIMTFSSQFMMRYNAENEQIFNIINGIMFMSISVISGINAFFGYGQLYEKHFSYSARYSDIAGRIERTLASKRKYREQSDVFVTEIKYSLDSLNENSPKIPMSIIKNYNN